MRSKLKNTMAKIVKPKMSLTVMGASQAPAGYFQGVRRVISEDVQSKKDLKIVHIAANMPATGSKNSL